MNNVNYYKLHYLHNIQKPLELTNSPISKRIGQRCARNNHDGCKNTGNFCSCKCHEVPN